MCEKWSWLGGVSVLTMLRLKYLLACELTIIVVNLQATTDSYTTSSLAWHLVPISLCNMILAAMNDQSTWTIGLPPGADMFRCTTMQQLLLLLLLLLLPPSPPPLSDHKWLPFFLPPSGHSTFASLATSANVQPTRWYILHAHHFLLFPFC